MHGVYISQSYVNNKRNEFLDRIATRKKAIKQKVPSGEDKTHAFENLKVMTSRVNWTLWNTRYTNDDGYVQIIVTAIPSSFSRMWSTGWEYPGVL